MKTEDKIALRYRNIGNCPPPKAIKIDIPGWAGKGFEARDGSRPEPWHCKPFVEGSTYGYELFYPFRTECKIIGGEGWPIIKADWNNEKISDIVWPPFRMANPEHYSFNSCLDIQVPKGYVLRIESHPRFFNDRIGDVPIVVPANLQSSWWPMLFFVTLKAPKKGEEHVFRYGEPYAQIFAIPESHNSSLALMNASERYERDQYSQYILSHEREISKSRWISKEGIPFNDAYKQLLKKVKKDDFLHEKGGE